MSFQPQSPSSSDSLNAAEILESVTDAFFALDHDWRFTYVNRQAERMLFRTREELLGRSIWAEFPEAVGSLSFREYHRAVEERISVSFEDYYAPLATWFENHLYPSPEGLSVYFRDINDRKQAEVVLRDTQARLEVALAAGGIATWDWDLVNERIIADANLAHLFSVSPEDAANGRIEDYLKAIHPEDRPRVTQAIEEAIARQEVYKVEYRVAAPGGEVRWLAARGRVERNAQGQAVSLPGVVVDITEQAERGRRERFLAELSERTRALTDSDMVIADAVRSVGQFLSVERCVFGDIDLVADTCTIAADYCADDTVASIVGVFSFSAFGPFVVAEYEAGRAVAVSDVRLDPMRVPKENVAAYEAIGIRAHVTAPVVNSARLVSVIAIHSATPRNWKSEEVELLQTVVERTWLTVEVIRQNIALVREAEERREAHERTAVILESVTDAFFALDRDWRFTYVNRQAEAIWGRTREQLLGRNVWEEFPEAVGSTFDRQFHRAMGEGIAVPFEEFYPPLDAWLDVRTYPSRDGLSVFFQNVNKRKRSEAEQERLLFEHHARAEREAFLNRIGQAVRATRDPEVIQETAAVLLGEALRADRCFYVTYDLANDQARVAQDWHQTGLSSIAGNYRASDFGPLLGELFPQERTAIIADVRTAFSSPVAALFEASQHRAVLVVPFYDSRGLVAALYVSMSASPRAWAKEEVSLVEQVATITRTTLEAALVSRKEHAIAQQLQDALQPALPERVSGLEVASFTRPALQEAQIGGDFFDVFPLDKELYALVIGDVSGKGLAAAQQLALIRNSLRTTLYLSQAPARAAASVNTIVSEHNLLVGFVTAFVGVYDAGTGQITYASCGHEPGLVRRAAGGAVEELVTTGPPLGVSQNAEYDEAQVTLASGDVLLLYTDGLSEAGPSRRELLGTAGLTRLLEALPVGPDVPSAAKTLVSGVSDFAGGVFRDDVAVLLARRL